ncbi:glycosyltransferase family 2 protein [Patescibacteria group bacterium]|nr:MAG: glycosyltransferase family 2 protein [Patescibacteria group bacterium]
MSRVILQLLTHARVDTLPGLLDSLLGQSDRDWELKILLNGVSDAVLPEMMSTILPYQPKLPMSIDQSEMNLGFAGGHQWLFERHQAPYVLLVNDDVICAPGYIAILRQYLDEHPRTAAVSGKLVRPDGRIDSLGLRLHLNGRVSNISEGKEDVPGRTEPFRVFGVAGTLPLLRREAVIQASHDGQLFDPGFGSYKEDVELAFRLQAEHWDCVVVPTVTAVHHRTFRRSWVHRGVSFYAVAHSYRNHLWNLFAFYPWSAYLRKGWAIIPFELAKLVFLLVTKPRAVTWAFSTSKANWKTLMAKRHHFV